jgi:S1-C subfamily serine protease
LDDFLSRVEAKKPGEEVVLTILRQDQQIKLPVRLEASD